MKTKMILISLILLIIALGILVPNWKQRVQPDSVQEKSSSSDEDVVGAHLEKCRTAFVADFPEYKDDVLDVFRGTKAGFITEASRHAFSDYECVVDVYEKTVVQKGWEKEHTFTNDKTEETLIDRFEFNLK